MLLLIILSPFIGTVLIMADAPARKTALYVSSFTLLLALAAFSQFKANDGFQFVSSWPIVTDLHLSFTIGLDGLSLLMVLLAAIVTVAAVWFAGEITRHEGAFYICLLLISGGVLGAFASLDLFFFYAFHELALIPTFLLIGIWGSGNRTAAAWKITIYLAL
ncbi:MAG: dehydrogenase subunit, partial [Spartobacteria bacterium]|nr:dehydrogenase subunit [Spartobacteria bacterium]